MIATRQIDVLRFLESATARGTPSAMVTLVGVEGSSSRSTGTQMAVSRDGGYAGSFSGGCIEAAVVAEAIRVIDEGLGRIVRFGSGSPYIDIRLPCGGGIDLLFTPVADATPAQAVLHTLGNRTPGAAGFGTDGMSVAEAAGGTGWRGGVFQAAYAPGLRAIGVGQGEDLLAFVRLSHRFGLETLALTPDRTALDAFRNEGIDASLINDRTRLGIDAGDRWTAIVFLFHDRDWEEFLLPQALEADGFYHGAIGSPNTHRARLDHLRTAGVAAPLAEKLRGCIGLIPSTRDPSTLALSIVAEIVDAYNAAVERLAAGN